MSNREPAAITSPVFLTPSRSRGRPGAILPAAQSTLSRGLWPRVCAVHSGTRSLSKIAVVPRGPLRASVQLTQPQTASPVPRQNKLLMSASDHSRRFATRGECPLWPRSPPNYCMPQSDAKNPVWTAPNWQGESSGRRVGRCSHVFGSRKGDQDRTPPWPIKAAQLSGLPSSRMQFAAFPTRKHCAKSIPISPLGCLMRAVAAFLRTEKSIFCVGNRSWQSMQGRGS